MSSRIVCRRKLTRPRIDCRIATCLRLGHVAKNSAQALFFATCPPGRDRSLLLQYTLWLFYFASLIKQLAGFSNPSRTHSRARATFHFVTCPPGRDRTFDRRLKRPLLYQLSYGRGLRECTMQFPSKQARNPPKNEWNYTTLLERILNGTDRLRFAPAERSGAAEFPPHPPSAAPSLLHFGEKIGGHILESHFF